MALSTPHPTDDMVAWQVSFFSGEPVTDQKSGTAHLWCLKGEPRKEKSLSSASASTAGPREFISQFLHQLGQCQSTSRGDPLSILHSCGGTDYLR